MSDRLLNNTAIGVLLGIILILSGELVSTREIRQDDNSKLAYHNYTSMTKYLRRITKENPDLTSLYSIGLSVQDRSLWVVEITAVPLNTTAIIPNIKLVGNIHGNEAAGREVLINFIGYLVESYRKGDRKVKHLLDNNRIHVLPSLNPDGFEIAIVGQCLRGPGRSNNNSEDLNRNFPDFFQINKRPKQKETMALSDWMNNKKFILSASLHGGAMVANYPFESTKQFSINPEPNVSPDDDVFQHLALVYAHVHPTMHKGEPCKGETDGRYFRDGITNGAAWYPLTGGMQDYNYAIHGCMELTLEISCCKYPKPEMLRGIWEANKNALVEFSLQSGRGVKGIIMDSLTKMPIKKANLTIVGRNMGFSSTPKGTFFRILLPGKYILKVNASNYKLKTTHFTVAEYNPNDIPKMTELNIYLKTFDQGIYEDEISTTEADIESTTEYLSSTETLGIFDNQIQERAIDSGANGHTFHAYYKIFVILLFIFLTNPNVYIL